MLSIHTNPLLFFCFLLPGLAYGIAAKTIRNDHDVAKMMGKTMAEGTESTLRVAWPKEQAAAFEGDGE